MVECPWCHEDFSPEEYRTHYESCLVRLRRERETTAIKLVEHSEEENREKIELETIIERAYQMHIWPYIVMGRSHALIRQWVKFFDTIMNAIPVGKYDAHYLAALLSEFFEKKEID